MATLMTLVAKAKVNANGNVDVDVDILEGGLTSSGVSPLLSEPHDQPYPTQPYATKLLQFHNLQIPIPSPMNSQQLAPGTTPWKGDYHVRATVRWCNHTTV